MNSPTCRQCDCIKGCQSKPTACPILLAECIKSGQVSAEQIESHRVLDAAICTPTQAQMLRNLAATMLEKELVEQPEPVSQPLTRKEIQEIWEIWESQVFPIIDLETDSPIAQLEQTAAVGKVMAPHYRGYANLGSGQYILNHTADLPAELIISIATEEEKAGRAVGDSQSLEHRAILHPKDMAVRLRFENVLGLDALEQQLRFLREELFPESIVGTK